MSTRENARRHRGSHPMRPAAPKKPPVHESKLWPGSDAAHAVQWWANRIEKPLFVYFIQDANGPVKIGKAYDPRTRLSELQCGNPMPLKLRHVVLSAGNTERRLHVAWAPYCIQGEWFGADQAKRILELAGRVQREQIVAFKRNKPEADVLAMPGERISPDVQVAIRKVVSL